MSIIQITGQVTPGFKNPSKFMQSDRALYEKALGTTLYPGTINVMTPDPHGRYSFLQRRIYPADVRAKGHLGFCPCTLTAGADRHEAFILATWHPCHHVENGITSEHRDKTLFEVVAAVKIDGIHDWASVSLEYDPVNTRRESVR